MHLPPWVASWPAVLGESTHEAQLQDGYLARCKRMHVLRSVVDMFSLAVLALLGPSTLRQYKERWSR